MLQATLPEIKLALSSKSRDLLSHVISECMQMRGRIRLAKRSRMSGPPKLFANRALIG